MSRRSIQLIIALLVGVIALATALDVFAPISESEGGRMMTVFDLPFGRSLGRYGGSQLGAISLRAPLPRWSQR